MATHESLIEKIQSLPEEAIEKVEVFVDTLRLEHPMEINPKPSLYGSMKGKFIIPDDFNEPLDDLKEYM